ncbi:MAG TPA: hypothetical protein DEP05_06730 [Betaproteobacteria bacterium]|nr:hypothetical protein [Betaproteobacteria bacterium]
MKLLMLFALGWLTVASALANPFPQGNPARGKMLVGKSCVSCHASLYGGNGSGIYTRPDRKIKSAAQLKQQVHRCGLSVRAKLFPEEEEHIAAYLNLNYYHFK